MRLLDKARYQNKMSPWTKTANYLLVIALGSVMGYMSEYLEYRYYHYPQSQSIKWLFGGLILIGNGFSLWIFVATMLAYFSRSPLAAAVHVFSFLTIMCIVYFVFKTDHYGYPIYGQLFFWCIIAIFAAGLAVGIWFSRIGGWKGAIMKAMPIAAIISEVSLHIDHCIQQTYGTVLEVSFLKYVFLPDRLVQIFMYLFFIVVLFTLLPRGAKEHKRVALLSCGFGTVLSILLLMLF